MTRNYSIGQRYMAYFLLGSVLLQSCYNTTIPSPRQVGIVTESKVPSMVLTNLEAGSLEEEALSPCIETKQGPISIEQGSKLGSSSKLKAVPPITHQSSFPKKNMQDLSARKPVLRRKYELQEQRKLVENRQSLNEKAPLSPNPLAESTKVVEIDQPSPAITYPCEPSGKEIPHHSSSSPAEEYLPKASFSNTLQGIYSQARSSFTKKVNTFSAFLSQEIKEVSALVNMPTVFQINFGEDKAFWRAHYQADIEELKTTSCPSLAAQQELLEKQDLVWSGLLSPYHYQAGLQELASRWPAALLQTIQDKWEKRLSEQPALLERFLLDDLRTCFQDNLQSTWSIETFQDILSFYGQRMNALDYKSQLVYVREAVIKNKPSNVLKLGEEKELIAAFNKAIERSSKLERRRLQEERRRFYGQAKELPFFFADEEVSPLGIWNDVAEVIQDKDVSAEEEIHKNKPSSSDELGAASLFKSLGKGLMRGIDFSVKHPLEAVVMGLSIQVAAAAAMNAFTAPKSSHKTKMQEAPHENKADKPVSHQSLAKKGLGDEFQISQNITGGVGRPSLTIFPSGNVFVTWDGNADIYGRLFDPSGIPLSNEFIINQNTTGNQFSPSLTTLPNGNAFVIWQGEQTGNADIYGRVFDLNGTALSNEFPINQNTTGDQRDPSLTTLPNGNAFIIWQGEQTGNADIYGRVFALNGTALSNEFTINQVTTGGQDYPSLTSFANGDALVTWYSGADIYGRLFDPNGTALINQFQINQNTTGNQFFPSLTSLPNGNAFVTWTGDQTGNRDIYGRVFGPNGTALSNEFTINQNTTSRQDYPSLISLGNGNVFVTWQGDQTGNRDIYGRLFDPNGIALSNEFPINQVVMGSQVFPSLASLPNGNVFVTWQGDQTGNENIYGRILTASFLPAFGITTGEVTTNQLTTAPLTTNGVTTGGVTTNQPTTTQATTNGLTTSTPTTKEVQTTGLMSTTALDQSQSSQEQGALTLGLGILGGVGGAALLTLGSIAAWKYYSYKRNKKPASQSEQRQDRELELENRPPANPVDPTYTGYSNPPRLGIYL